MRSRTRPRVVVPLSRHGGPGEDRQAAGGGRRSEIGPMAGRDRSPAARTAEAMTAGDRRGQLRVGVLSPLLGPTFESATIRGVNAVAESAGARVVAVQTLDLSVSLDWCESATPHLNAPVAWDQVAGFVVVLKAAEPWYLRSLLDAGKPVVLISEHVESLPIPVVQPDNRSGVVRAVAHLVEHGHRRIGFAGSMVQPDVRERHQAYREALIAHGIDPSDDLVFEATSNVEEGGVAAGRRMLDAGLPSTAVVAATDYNAIGIMAALREAGLVLPRDQAVVGFDDVEESTAVRPTLSTVHQRFEELGREAARLLLRMIRGDRMRPGRHLVSTEFVVRESCGCTSASAVRAAAGLEPAPAATPRERLRTLLERRLVGEHPATARQAAALDRVVEVVAAAADHGGGPSEDGIRDAAQAICSVSPRWTAIADTVACLRQYREQLPSRRRGRTAAARRGLADIVVELSRLLAEREASSRTALNVTAGEDYRLSMSLLSATGGDPRSLGWLAHTRARMGCLGVWGESGGERSLEVVSAYPPESGSRGRLRGCTPVQSFPPSALLDDPAWGPGEMAIVLPVKTDRADIGLLAMVVPAATEPVPGRDPILERGSLFSLALEREITTERLSRSRAELETFSHAMAHDLRNPLATIAMWVAVARSQAAGGADPETVAATLDRIGEVAGYANDLITDLLHFAELESAPGALQPVSLGAALERALVVLRSSIVQTGAVVEAGDLPAVAGRVSELELLLQNLLENSIKYRSAEPPRIRIAAAPGGDGTWTLRLRDNGRGIPAEVSERVFDPFVRGSAEGSGSGLGLATCRRIVERHGGTIWVEETGGGGTVMAVTLRSAPEPAGAPPGGFWRDLVRRDGGTHRRPTAHRSALEGFLVTGTGNGAGGSGDRGGVHLATGWSFGDQDGHRDRLLGAGGRLGAAGAAAAPHDAGQAAAHDGARRRGARGEDVDEGARRKGSSEHPRDIALEAATPRARGAAGEGGGRAGQRGRLRRSPAADRH